ncbi:SMI1/KNR4 family protein [Dactylosporangium sp. AC04546]|uniref:SMI1/KNR4 family protein n=1 Tax=Dactylosporangium sp. AC04546 TaxID=2862460 RepID=UPI001EDCA11B|nr:SMI1/KNR4 family protein [Dactylosporangium sp. AC04546]WVK80570.1 SMI1/KNR4 family protein [Dactylosporangium sp. AC04546]
MTDEEIFEAIRRRVGQGRPTDLDHKVSLPAPALEEDVRRAEGVIGYPLPPLVRRIYLELADGGIGPFGGIEGVTEGDSPLVEQTDGPEGPYDDPDEPPAPPRGVVFFCDFGCAMWALLDCRHPQGQMWWWSEGERHKLHLTLPEWFAAWLAGQSHDVWARESLWLGPESWTREEAEERRQPQQGPVALDPGQMPLW